MMIDWSWSKKKIMGKKSTGIKQDADGFDLPSDEARAGKKKVIKLLKNPKN